MVAKDGPLLGGDGFRCGRIGKPCISSLSRGDTEVCRPPSDFCGGFWAVSSSRCVMVDGTLCFRSGCVGLDFSGSEFIADVILFCVFDCGFEVVLAWGFRDELAG